MKDFIKENKSRLVEMYATNENEFANDVDELIKILIEGRAIDKSAICEIGLQNINSLINEDRIKKRIFNATNPYGEKQ